MSVIKILPEEVANKIAAGEVVERPASVVKELVENALDASSTRIFVAAQNGGKNEITVTDNGVGMKRDDLLLALERHATSKIATAEDLASIRTLGFRGEAIPSIAAVSRLEITTGFKGDSVGHRVRVYGGVIQGLSEVAATQGTDVKMTQLFYNTPARLKFLKSVSTELDHITEMLVRLSLAHPEIHFRFHHNGREVLDFLPTHDVKHRLSSLWGANIMEQLLEISPREMHGMRIKGYLASPAVTRSSRRHLYTFVNRRWVGDPLLNSAIYGGYKPFLPSDRFPMAVLFLEIDPEKVDVNVHPTKNEVRFAESRYVAEAVRQAVYQALLNSSINQTMFSTSEAEKPSARIMEWPPSSSRFQEIPAALEKPIPNLPAPSLLRDNQAIPLGEERLLSLSALKVLAQLGDSYVLCQAPGGLTILDQHAAHERITYEKLKRNYLTGSIPKQALLMPEVVELSPVDFGLLSKTLGRLEKLGLEMEPFGGTSMVVKFVPAVLAQAHVQELVAEIVDSLHDLPLTLEEEAFLERMLSLMACHGSIRANQRLSREEMEHLVYELGQFAMPLYCPHGRPIFVNISYDQIEKDLKRR
jgi:DNA mismatch repair protein MutL